MDKYRRDDDVNDDLGVYNQQDDFQGISSRPVRNTYERGRVETDGLFQDRVAHAQNELTEKEIELMILIMTKGLSIRAAAKEMGISQQMASKYWKRIKEKLA